MQQDIITLAHGAGTRKSKELIARTIEILGSAYIGQLEDSSKLDFSGRLAITTDSFVVQPLFFSGGDIGKIAVCGTVNDLAVSGARALALSLALIIEEGLDFETFERIISSIRDTANSANVKIICGDTKVVRKGEADKIYINTTGIGCVVTSPEPSMKRVMTGDVIILTHSIGDHVISLLSAREGLGFDDVVRSDCAPLNHVLLPMLEKFSENVHSVRDVTRGGVAAVLHEYSEEINKIIEIDFNSIPLSHPTRMATDMLDVNPLYLANEGTACIFCSKDISEDLLDFLKTYSETDKSCIIGLVTELTGNDVYIINGEHKDVLPYQEDIMLPRLC
ncbi:hydrogenase expression/formation protein HypE [Serratia fonticola]|uniref:hydrogenase expression/formation protein HypE n=1 Tax=Serratia fonticola TaxID=47917 RepID=UPI00217C7306|nr:hydrogenase expression/formation protein HypE [Serratia fonticola]CAI0878226.1 Hydrogenase isoenzymes formation protein hypE [Serratia fonticola]CAI0911119.1 Hydrogenase isoenzymes formation protein hypE [Serratia fonticola]